MDDALKKISQVLESERPVSRLKELLPQSKEPAKSPEQAMGITHYTKAKTEPAPEPQSRRRPPAVPSRRSMRIRPPG
jgi:hypothetical protein